METLLSMLEESAGQALEVEIHHSLVLTTFRLLQWPKPFCTIQLTVDFRQIGPLVNHIFV